MQKDLAAGSATHVTVMLPSALMRLFPDSPRVVELHAGTIDELIDALNELWPGMRDRLCDSSPAIRRHLNIFVDGNRAALDTTLVAGTRVTILTAMSGG